MRRPSMLLLAATLVVAPSLTFAPDSASALSRLDVAMSDDVVLDPHRGPLPGSWLASRLVHRGLFAFPHEAHPAGSKPVPDLAAEPLRRITSRRVEVPLRTATFSNGRAMQAGDVVWSLRRFAQLASGAGRYAATISGVSIVDPQASPVVIRIETSRPMPELTWLLAHPQAAILPAGSSIGSLGPRGLGPYRVASRRFERSIVLIRNTHWQALDDPIRSALADRVVLRIRGNGNAAFRSVADGRAHLVGDPGPPDVFDQSNAPVRSIGRCTRFVAINATRSGLDRLAARRAIRNALEGIDLATRGTAPAASLLPPLVTGARELPRSVKTRRVPIGRTLVLAGSDTPRDRRELPVIAQRLRGAGAQVQIQYRPAGLHVRQMQAPAASRPDLAVFTWCAEWPGLAGRTFLEALTGPGRLAHRSAAFHEALGDALRASPGQGVDAWRQADRRLWDAAVLVAVGWPAEPAAFRSFAGTPMTSPMFPQGDPANSSAGL